MPLLFLAAAACSTLFKLCQDRTGQENRGRTARGHRDSPGAPSPEEHPWGLTGLSESTQASPKALSQTHCLLQEGGGEESSPSTFPPPPLSTLDPPLRPNTTSNPPTPHSSDPCSPCSPPMGWQIPRTSAAARTRRSRHCSRPPPLSSICPVGWVSVFLLALRSQLLMSASLLRCHSPGQLCSLVWSCA